MSSIQGLLGTPVAYEKGKLIANDGRSNWVGFDQGVFGLRSNSGRSDLTLIVKVFGCDSVTRTLTFGARPSGFNSGRIIAGVLRLALALRRTWPCPFLLPFPFFTVFIKGLF